MDDLSGIELAWEDNSNSEEHFLIERKTTGGSWQQVAELDADTTRYVDPVRQDGVEVGVSYIYRVRAMNSSPTAVAQYSGYCDEAGATIVLPTLTISADIPDASEFKGDWGQFLATRDLGSLGRRFATVFNLTMSGTAKSDEYSWLSGFSIAAGQTKAFLPFKAAADDVVEITETVIATLAESTSYLRGTPFAATAQIIEENLIDIDSDNNNGFDNPDQTKIEDLIETKNPGKIILANDDDGDGDGVIDYLDGYNRDGNSGTADDTPPTADQGERFTPVFLYIPAGLNPTLAVYNIAYSAFEPRFGGSGLLRLWTKDGSQTRNGLNFVDGGDFVNERKWDHSLYYDWADLSKLPWTAAPGGAQRAKLFVEGTSIGAGTITFSIDPDGEANGVNFSLADSVQVTVVKVDLDVNGDGDLSDAVDLAQNYLPGYRGSTAVLSTGNTFNTTNYVGQQMKLIADGLGTSIGVEKVTFVLVGPTNYAGYAENATNAAIQGAGKDDDFSFKADADDVSEDGTLEAGKAWADFWCKDYGAWGKIRVLATIGGNTFLVREFTVPADSDGDSIADKWERQAVADWNAQYGAPETIGTGFFSAAEDKELIDPDGTTEALGCSPAPAPAPANRNQHATAGDGRSVKQEYRGYILDGGGFDWDGNNGHGGGHARLSPVYKELLVEVDAMERSLTPHMPDRAGIAAWMDVVSSRMSQRHNGSGLRMYYLLEDLATAHTILAGATVAAYTHHLVHPMMTSFKHLCLIDSFSDSTSSGMSGDTFATYATNRGWNFAQQFGIDFNTSSSAYISHELHHTTVHQPGDDGGEHFNDTNANGVEGPLQSDLLDQEFVLWNYNYRLTTDPTYVYTADDMRHIWYGRGTTRYIDIR